MIAAAAAWLRRLAAGVLGAQICAFTQCIFIFLGLFFVSATSFAGIFSERDQIEHARVKKVKQEKFSDFP
jgi:hypothetical protein